MTMRAKIIEALKSDWHSNLQIIELVKSGSADRTVRNIRENPPIGFKVISRPKKIEGYNSCLEYKLVEVASDGVFNG